MEIVILYILFMLFLLPWGIEALNANDKRKSFWRAVDNINGIADGRKRGTQAAGGGQAETTAQAQETSAEDKESRERLDKAYKDIERQLSIMKYNMNKYRY